jgi:formylglycine-generating enzyme required for sulfatase activity
MKNFKSVKILATVLAIIGYGGAGAAGDVQGVNSVGMTFVRIPAGTFLMGSAESEPYRDKGEVRHRVTISKPFDLQTTEVTNKQWRQVMALSWFRIVGRHRGPDHLPVTQVCHHDIEKFLVRLNALGEGRYRLPTEAEWEYAARAGTTTAYSWGERIGCSEAMYANHPSSANDCHDYAAVRDLPQGGPAPVKSYPPNPWGLYDMHGNVWEIVADWYGPYAPGPQTDPRGPAAGAMQVRRGGSWASTGAALRSANRAYLHPASRLRNTGFRVVREPN